MYIARRDFFLSWEASYVYNFLTIAVILRRFLLVGPQPKIAKRVAPIKNPSCYPAFVVPVRSPASSPQRPRVSRSQCCLLTPRALRNRMEAANLKLSGWEALTREGLVA